MDIRQRLIEKKANDRREAVRALLHKVAEGGSEPKAKPAQAKPAQAKPAKPAPKQTPKEQSVNRINQFAAGRAKALDSTTDDSAERATLDRRKGLMEYIAKGTAGMTPGFAPEYAKARNTLAGLGLPATMDSGNMTTPQELKTMDETNKALHTAKSRAEQFDIAHKNLPDLKKHFEGENPYMKLDRARQGVEAYDLLRQRLEPLEAVPALPRDQRKLIDELIEAGIITADASQPGMTKAAADRKELIRASIRKNAAWYDNIAPEAIGAAGGGLIGAGIGGATKGMKGALAGGAIGAGVGAAGGYGYRKFGPQLVDKVRAAIKRRQDRKTLAEGGLDPDQLDELNKTTPGGDQAEEIRLHKQHQKEIGYDPAKVKAENEAKSNKAQQKFMKERDAKKAAETKERAQLENELGISGNVTIEQLREMKKDHDAQQAEWKRTGYDPVAEKRRNEAISNAKAAPLVRRNREKAAQRLIADAKSAEESARKLLARKTYEQRMIEEFMKKNNIEPGTDPALFADLMEAEDWGIR